MKALITTLSVALFMVFSSQSIACSGAKDKYAEASTPTALEIALNGDVKKDELEPIQSTQ